VGWDAELGRCRLRRNNVEAASVDARRSIAAGSSRVSYRVHATPTRTELTGTRFAATGILVVWSCALAFAACARNVNPDARTADGAAPDATATGDVTDIGVESTASDVSSTDTQRDDVSDALADDMSNIVAPDVAADATMADALDAADVAIPPATYTVCGAADLACHPFDNRGCRAGETCHFVVEQSPRTSARVRAACMPSAPSSSSGGSRCTGAQDCPLGFDCGFDSPAGPQCVPMCCLGDPIDGEARCAAAPRLPCEPIRDHCFVSLTLPPRPFGSRPAHCTRLGLRGVGYFECDPFGPRPCPSGQSCQPNDVTASAWHCSSAALFSREGLDCSMGVACGSEEVCALGLGGPVCRRRCDPTALLPAPDPMSGACEWTRARYCPEGRTCVHFVGAVPQYGRCESVVAPDASLTIDAAILDADSRDAMDADLDAAAGGDAAAAVDAGPSGVVGPCAPSDGGPGHPQNSEAAERLLQIAASARDAFRAYWRDGGTGLPFASAPLTPASIPPGVCVTDPAGTWSSPTWRALGFAFGPGERHAYSYEIYVADFGGRAAFSARALGNLDGDGDASTFEVVGIENGSGDVTIFPPWRVQIYE